MERKQPLKLQGHMVNGKPLKVEWSGKAKREMGLSELVAGQLIIVSGLQGAPQYNGHSGRVMSVRPDGRYEVELQLDGEEKILALKGDNLIPTRIPATEGSGSGDQPKADESATNNPAEPGPSNDSTANAGIEGDAEEKCVAEETCGTKATSEAEGNSSINAEAVGEDAGTGRRKRRKSAWGGENEGGIVYVEHRGGDQQKVQEQKSALCSLPPESELNAMSAKELRQLLTSNQINVAGCFEKADLLERARCHVNRAADG